MVRTRPMKVFDVANRVLLVIGAVAVVVMMLHIVVNAIMRSVGDAPLTGTNEYVTYWYMPLVAMLGFIVAQRARSHTEAAVVFDRLPRRNRFELRVIGLLLVAVMCGGFAYFGWIEAVHNWELELTGGVIGVVIWPVTFLVPITYAVLAVQVLTEVVLLSRRPDRLDSEERETADGGVEGHAIN